MNPPALPSLLILSLVCLRPALAADPPGPAPSPARPFAAMALANPRSVAVDAAGNLYVADVDRGDVQKITPSGKVSAAAGAGAAMIHDPIGLKVARDGSVLVADSDDGAVYIISPAGVVTAMAQPSGAARFAIPTSAAEDSAGNLYVANNGSHVIVKITPGGVASVFAGKPGASGSADGKGSDARFNVPRDIAMDGQDDLYVADEGNSNIRKITPDGIVSTLAGTAGKPGKADGEGPAAGFDIPRGIAVDAAGTIYVADTENHCIRKITPAGVVSTFAGEAGKAAMADGIGAAARFSEPRGIALDAAGNLYVADTGNLAIREITPGGVVSTIAGAAASPVFPIVSAPAPIIAPRTGRTERFDYTHAQTLDGWDGDPRYWSVKDGAFDAKGERVQSNFLLTQKSFTDFRLTFSSRVMESENHAGVCLWGNRVALENGKNKWAYKGPLLMFPGLGIWDYSTEKNIRIEPAGKILARKLAGQHDWIRIEMLAQGNRLRVAFDGQQVLDWRAPDPARLVAGPIGLQLHGFTNPQEVIYKDVVIETFPKEDHLITVKQ
jgi:sugar lactone lactonase YvrE